MTSPHAPTPSLLRSLYRSFLRELPSRPLSTRSPLHHRIRETFASASPSSTVVGAGAGNEADALRETQHADQYIQYIRAQRMYVTLLERYNPGMGMDEEERVRLSARRVGMNMPVEFGGKKGGEE